MNCCLGGHVGNLVVPLSFQAWPFETSKVNIDLPAPNWCCLHWHRGPRLGLTSLDLLLEESQDLSLSWSGMGGLLSVSIGSVLFAEKTPGFHLPKSMILPEETNNRSATNWRGVTWVVAWCLPRSKAVWSLLQLVGVGNPWDLLRVLRYEIKAHDL